MNRTYSEMQSNQNSRAEMVLASSLVVVADSDFITVIGRCGKKYKMPRSDWDHFKETGDRAIYAFDNNYKTEQVPTKAETEQMDEIKASRAQPIHGLQYILDPPPRIQIRTRPMPNDSAGGFILVMPEREPMLVDVLSKEAFADLVQKTLVEMIQQTPGPELIRPDGSSMIPDAIKAIENHNAKTEKGQFDRLNKVMKEHFKRLKKSRKERKR